MQQQTKNRRKPKKN